MGEGTHESKGIVGSFEHVGLGKGGNLSGNLSRSSDEIELGTLSIRELNSGDVVGGGEEGGILDVNTKDLESSRRRGNLEVCGRPEAGDSLDQASIGGTGRLSALVSDNASASEGNKDWSSRECEIVLDCRGTILKASDGRGNGETTDQTEQRSSGNLTNLGGGVVVETVIIIDSQSNVSDDGGRLEGNGSELGLLKGQKQSSAIDMKCGEGKVGFKDVLEGERVCRICHLSSDGCLEETATTATIDLIQLGCGCKDELGIAHSHCAEAWFKLRRNRTCEICGETAKNVEGDVDNRFMEQWSERRFIRISGRSSDRGGGCWRVQPFCNFLMACLVIAFVLPWLFRVDLF